MNEGWWSSVVVVVALSGCGTLDALDAQPPAKLQQAATQKDPGALVRVTMTSTVGVTLDELPAAVRTRVANGYLARPQQFWLDRARAQVTFTYYRLIYRDFFYNAGNGTSGSREMMPITQPNKWAVTLHGSPTRTSYNGHDVVSVTYDLSTTILADVDSVAASEPNLSNINGSWDEPYELPLDPEFLLQRTGYACVDEDGYPRNTADSENIARLYDHTCLVEAPGHEICHLSTLPQESCVQALDRAVGRVTTQLHFARLPWSAAAAAQVRDGAFTQTGVPDIQPIGANLAENRVIYKYIAPNACAVAEGCVSGTGWRRLLAFTSSVKNTGNAPLIGGSVAAGSPYLAHHVYEFSPCHQHYHFSHYAEFDYGPLPGEKRAFCLESTSRYFNNEQTPLSHPFGCANQGVAPGWGDDYIAGVECQWIDITSTQGTAVTYPLSTLSNPDGFLCEGTPVVDAQGNRLFEPTNFVSEQGFPVDRPRCDVRAGTASNNFASLNVSVPSSGGMVTAPCTRGQQGALRDCGFKENPVRTCVPGQSVTLTCTKKKAADPLQLVRVCEASAQLATGTACTFDAALGRATVDAATTVTFTCPAARDATEPGGRYALYTAPVVDGDATSQVTCN
ncbi:MAG: hypothetical protein IPJ65_41265 [Archangiaceae bacterium]|nr:hypothetical protein [Archangiaceae bacterium]